MSTTPRPSATVILLLFFAGFFLGNWAGDRQTLIDCAQQSEAKMLGGGMISCKIQTDRDEINRSSFQDFSEE